jgi:hypothetical protein
MGRCPNIWNLKSRQVFEKISGYSKSDGYQSSHIVRIRHPNCIIQIRNPADIRKKISNQIISLFRCSDVQIIYVPFITLAGARVWREGRRRTRWGSGGSWYYIFHQPRLIMILYFQHVSYYRSSNKLF